MRPCSKTDHYFLLAVKEDFYFEKQFCVLKIYLRLLHGKNKLFKISGSLFLLYPQPLRARLYKCGLSVIRLVPPAVEIRNSLDKALLEEVCNDAILNP